MCSCYAAKKHAERDQQVVDMELDALGDPSESEGDSKVIEVKKQGPQEPTTSSKSFPSGSGSGSDQVAAQEETTKSDEHYDDHGTKGLFKDWQRAFREDPEHPLDSKVMDAMSPCPRPQCQSSNSLTTFVAVLCCRRLCADL